MNRKGAKKPTVIPIRDEGHSKFSKMIDKSMNHYLNDLSKDWRGIVLLMFLYILQGIPLGLAGSIPLILQNRNVTYQEQAIYSFVFWPFSLKLLWAPFIDSVYSLKFGRRKSWLVPTQLAIGLFMYCFSYRADAVLYGGANPSGKPDVPLLATIFFALTFLATVQDVAVDAWALTILSRDNIGWASTCNSVGQSAGFFIGNAVFLVLESKDFCNAYLRPLWDYSPQESGLITISDFLYFWSIVFVLTTILIAIFVQEKNSFECDNAEHEEIANLGIVGTYRILLRIIRMPNVQILLLQLLTVKVGFSPVDALTGLKLIEYGVPKERIAALAVILTPVEIFLPLVISKYTSGPRPMDIYLWAIFPRLVMGLALAGAVYVTPYFRMADHQFPLWYYVVLMLTFGLHQIFHFSFYVSQVAFFAQISDPLVGGTYMTLLNTGANLGGDWPNTVSLWLADYLNIRRCEAGVCETVIDAYFIEVTACFIIGCLWLYLFRTRSRRLQDIPTKTWRIIKQ